MLPLATVKTRGFPRQVSRLMAVPLRMPRLWPRHVPRFIPWQTPSYPPWQPTEVRGNCRGFPRTSVVIAALFQRTSSRSNFPGHRRQPFPRKSSDNDGHYLTLPVILPTRGHFGRYFVWIRVRDRVRACSMVLENTVV